MASDPTRALSTPPIEVADPNVAADGPSAAEAVQFDNDLTAEARAQSAEARQVEAVRELQAAVEAPDDEDPDADEDDDEV